MRVFTTRWKRGTGDLIKISAVDESGHTHEFEKRYRDWMGVCVHDIDRLVRKMQKQFIGAKIAYRKLDERLYTELLPLFYDRILHDQDLRCDPKHFYKVYVKNACMADVGDFLNNHHVSYHRKEDWLTRVYLDVCTQIASGEFYYRWYDIDPDERDLVRSMTAVPCGDTPRLLIASFDLETVPWQVGARRLPTGHDPLDVVVMASLVIGDVSTRTTVKSYLFYLNPIPSQPPLDEQQLAKQPLDEQQLAKQPLDVARDHPDTEYREHHTEKSLLRDFFHSLGDPTITMVTGYNINKFDLPCLFARAVHLDCPEIEQFTSTRMGTHTITRFRDKYVIDMYTYIMLFANGGLPSLKLDDVANARLGERKVPIRVTAIGDWYQARDRLDRGVLESTDRRRCYEVVRPDSTEDEFDTFRRCLSYSIKDSELVLRLVWHENAVQFLLSRSNMCSLNVEQVLYLGISKYIQNFFETYGTMLGYFVNAQMLRNVTGDAVYGDYPHKESKKRKKMGDPVMTYQGALNHCEPGFYKEVAVYDFESLYPSSIMVGNVSYETFAVVHSERLKKLSRESLALCSRVPYETHDDKVVFSNEETTIASRGEEFAFPTHDSEWVMVWLRDTRGFLPHVVTELKERRRVEKALMISDAPERRNYHDSRQLNFKLLMNSIYGVLGSTDTQLASMGAGMSVTCIARTMLINAYHFVRRRGYEIPYADTDSLFVVGHQQRMDELVNAYFAMPGIMNLQFENLFPTMLILMKKKYCYEQNGQIRAKGMEVKANALTKKMLQRVLRETYDALKEGRDADPGRGWCILVEILVDAHLTSRLRPFDNCTTVKVKSLDQYDPHCQSPHVRLMRRIAGTRITGDFISFVDVQTNVSVEATRDINPMSLEDVDTRYDVIDFEKLYIQQHTEMLNLLNWGFFRGDMDTVREGYRDLVHRIKWRQNVPAAIKFFHEFHEQPLILVDKSVRYPLGTKNTHKRRKTCCP